MKIVCLLFFVVSLSFGYDVDIIKLLDALGIKYTYHTSKVIKITDGDTIYVNVHNKKKSLRLIGADTPEVGGSKLKKDSDKCGISQFEMQKIGALASEYTKSQVKEGDEIGFILFGMDKYQRPVAYLLNNLSVKLVASGYAVAYDSPQFPSAINLAFASIEKYAKSNKLGLWKEYSSIMECIKK